MQEIKEVTLYRDGEKAIVEEGTPTHEHFLSCGWAPPADGEAPPEDPTPVENDKPLSEMDKAELSTLADSLGVKFHPASKADTIRRKIEEAQGE